MKKTADFHAQLSLGFLENGQKKKKFTVSGNSVGRNPLLIKEVEREFPDWFKLIEVQQ